MNEFALLIDNEFKEIRRYESKPQDISHKKITWHDVVREYGVPFVGLENGNWVIRTVDPSTLPPTVPDFVTSRQLRLFLLQSDMLDDVETIVATEDRATQIQWEYATEFHRNDPLLNQLATQLGITQEALDQFFIEASQI